MATTRNIARVGRRQIPSGELIRAQLFPSARRRRHPSPKVPASQPASALAAYQASHAGIGCDVSCCWPCERWAARCTAQQLSRAMENCLLILPQIRMLPTRTPVYSWIQLAETPSERLKVIRRRHSSALEPQARSVGRCSMRSLRRLMRRRAAFDRQFFTHRCTVRR